ncbi:hypothetical protein [Streptomyces scabichelini]|nr:hypothetical protein [Streptomyces scabichelini]
MPECVARVTLVGSILPPELREGVIDVTPWLRTLSSAGLLLVLAAAPAHASYTSPTASYAPSVAPSTPSASSYAVEPVPAESRVGNRVGNRAGSRAGEGRERPGREAAPEDDAAAARPEVDPGVPEVPEVPDVPVSPETTSGSDMDPEPSPHAAPPAPTEPVLRILPLGSGLVLMGLGLGLAFLALRVRRG